MVKYQIEEIEGEAQVVIAATATDDGEGIDSSVIVNGQSNLSMMAKIAGNLVGEIAATLPDGMMGDFLLMVNAAMMDALTGCEDCEREVVKSSFEEVED